MLKIPIYVMFGRGQGTVIGPLRPPANGRLELQQILLGAHAVGFASVLAAFLAVFSLTADYFHIQRHFWRRFWRHFWWPPIIFKIFNFCQIRRPRISFPTDRPSYPPPIFFISYFSSCANFQWLSNFAAACSWNIFRHFAEFHLWRPPSLSASRMRGRKF